MLWFVTLAIKSTAIMTIAWIVAYALRSRSAAARHLVWTAAAAAVLALPLLSISLPAIAVPAIPLDAGVLFTATAGARAEANATPVPQRSGAATPAPRASWRPDWRLPLLALWAAGALTALVQMLYAYAGMWRLRRAARPSAHRDLAAELAHALGIRRPVAALDTAAGTMPMTFGILRPAVLLPSDTGAWSDGRRRMVLLPERAH